MPKQCDIVLVPIPFTDLSSAKRRPVVVISNDAYNRQSADFVVAAMTSNLIETDYGITITTKDLNVGALNRSSKIRCDRVYTLAQSIVVKRFGAINDATFDKIRKLLDELTSRKT